MFSSKSVSIARLLSQSVVRKMSQKVPSSRLALRHLNPVQRARLVEETVCLPQGTFDTQQVMPSLTRLDQFSENVVAPFVLPNSVGTNFVVNGRSVLLPMTIEEPSVVAASSNGAKLVALNDGFKTSSSAPVIIGQIQLMKRDSDSTAETVMDILRHPKTRNHLTDYIAQNVDKYQRLKNRGGGFVGEFQVTRCYEDMVLLEFKCDVQDAMGANLINTFAEAAAPEVKTLTGWDTLLRILSNNASDRYAEVSVSIEPRTLTTTDWDGVDIAKRVVEASRLAECNENRALTHNKGIMNGVTSIAIATGQDTRALSSAAEFHARELGVSPETKSSQYGPLATWSLASSGFLEGRIQLPIPVGVVGRLPDTHPGVKANLAMMGNPSAQQLGEYMACAGLSSNLAALIALGTVGINKGHIALHERSVLVDKGL